MIKVKKWLFALGLFLIVTAGFPFFKGIIFEHMVRWSVDNINRAYADTGHFPVIEILNYTRHYSDSVIEWKLGLGLFKDVLEGDDIVLLDHVRHGVSTIVSSTSIEKNSWYKKIRNPGFNAEDPIIITTKYSFSGNIGSTIHLNDFSIKDGKKEIRADIFSLKSDIQIPYTLVGYRQDLLSPLYPGMQTGLFITKGETLFHQAQIHDGKLLLNQKEVVLE